jgi:protein-tyrosine phosphatase
MIRVMFVCHGNICRSPMAEMIMKELVRRAGLSDRFVIASAGTSDEEICGGIGNPIYPSAQRVLKKNGILFTEHRAVQLTRADYAKYDLFIGMDRANLYNMDWMLGGDPLGKIHPLLRFAGRHEDVSDPWFTERFDEAFADIMEGCTALLQYLIKKEGLQ